jgi:enoyl-CoA hydratase
VTVRRQRPSVTIGDERGAPCGRRATRRQGENVKLNTSHMIVEQDGAVGRMIFNNPERRNALSYEMRLAVLDILDEFERDDSIRVIVMTGAGDKAFSSGIDLSPAERDVPRQEAGSSLGDRVQHRFETLTKPLIAMIRGYCMGGGMNIALHADIRVASDTAQFGIPATRLGIAYPFRGVRKLVATIGAPRARQVLLTGDRFAAADALQMGLVHSVEADARLEETVRAMASRIGEGAPLSLKAAKLMIDEVMKDPDQRDVAFCDDLVSGCAASEDAAEGRRAFREKRKARFIGR